MGLFDRFKKKKEENFLDDNYMENLNNIASSGLNTSKSDDTDYTAFLNDIANSTNTNTINNNKNDESDLTEVRKKTQEIQKEMSKDDAELSKVANNVYSSFEKEKFDKKYGEIYDSLYKKYLFKDMGINQTNDDPIYKEIDNWNIKFNDKANAIDLESLMMPFLIEKENNNIELNDYERKILVDKKSKFDNEKDYLLDIMLGAKIVWKVYNVFNNIEPGKNRDQAFDEYYPALHNQLKELHDKMKKNNEI